MDDAKRCAEIALDIPASLRADKLVRVNVSVWPIASFRSDAEFGRYRRICGHGSCRGGNRVPGEVSGRQDATSIFRGHPRKTYEGRVVRNTAIAIGITFVAAVGVYLATRFLQSVL